MKISFCYVGHGAMNYIEIYEGGKVISRFLVDAGSTADKSQTSNFNNNLEYIEKQICNSELPLMILITHLHQDHYNLLNRLHIPGTMTGWIYVGSIPSTWMLGPQDDLEMFRLLHKKMEFKTLTRISPPQEIKHPGLSLGNVSVYCLWNNYFRQLLPRNFGLTFCSGNYNSNGAAFAFICGSTAVIFSGDMTGENFQSLSTKGKLATHVKKLLNCHQVYMTVPHHGSLHTLQKPDNKPFVSWNPNTQFFDTTQLQNVMTATFQCPLEMYISADKFDQFGHPDCMAALAYDNAGNKTYAFPASYEASLENGYPDPSNPPMVRFEQFPDSPDNLLLKDYRFGTLNIEKGNTVSLLGVKEGRIELTVEAQ